MAEVGELGALQADQHIYKEAIKMPDAKQFEEVLRTEMKNLGRLGVSSAPCPLPYGTKKIKTRAILKKHSNTGAWSAGGRSWWPRGSFKHSVWTSPTPMPQLHG